MTNPFIQELTERELDQAAGGEAAPAGNAASTLPATQGNAGSSPYWASWWGRTWCYWHPYVCR
jgi:hypothetical protein